LELASLLYSCTASKLIIMLLKIENYFGQRHYDNTVDNCLILEYSFGIFLPDAKIISGYLLLPKKQ